MPKRTKFAFYLPAEDGRATLVPKGTPHTPELAEQLKGNPDAFETYDDTPPAEEQPAAPEPTTGPPARNASGGDGTPSPPAGNAKTEEWAAFAKAVGVDVAEDATREDIKTELADRGLLS